MFSKEKNANDANYLEGALLLQLLIQVILFKNFNLKGFEEFFFRFDGSTF